MMLVEKIDSVLGDVLSRLCVMECKLISTGFEMSSSWISVMQATVDDLLLMTQMLFGFSRSSLDHHIFFFFFISGSLLDLLLFLFRVVQDVDLHFLGFLSNYLPNPSLWNSAYPFLCYLFTVDIHKIMISST